MIQLSIRRKIMGIAIALIVLMVITAVLSLVWIMQGPRVSLKALRTITSRSVWTLGAGEYPFS